MSEAVVATGTTEVIEAMIVDVNNAAITGLTDIKIDCRRKSDGKLIDWNDMTFKSSGWTTRQLALTETDATNEAGWYRYSFVMANIVSPVANDVYTVTVRQTSLTTAANVPQFGVIRTGVYVDTIAANLVTKTAYVTGTASAGAAQSITLAGLSAVDQFYRFCVVEITGGTGAGQSRAILNYVGSTKVASVARPWTTNPDATSTFIVHPFAQPGILDAGLAQAGGASTITLLASSSATNNIYAGLVVSIAGGTGVGQERVIVSYVGATQVATVDTAWTTAPDSTSIYILTPTGRAMVSAGGIAAAAFATDAVDANALAASAVAEIQSGLATAAALATVQADTDDIQTRLPAALVAGRMDASVGAMATDTLTAAALAASAVTEIQSGLATSAEIAGVQADVDDLQTRVPAALVGGRIDASVGAVAANAITATAIATDAITAAKIAAGAIGASEAPLLANLDVASSTLATAAALTAVAADVDDVQARLPAALVSGRIDASVGAMAAGVVTATAIGTDAITSAKIAAGAIGASEAPLLANLDVASSTLATAAALATAQGNITTILGFGAAPTAAANAAAVWATADGAGTMGASLALLRRRQTNKRVLSAGGVLSFYADDGTTVEKTATITDVDGAAVTIVAGDPARSTAEV